ncbi:MAG: CDP-glycerol glycerophosphotransferase family protein [Eubacteriales bacterium]|nr:CDP-glycerol glycerophosphotransferase family protein [Eubacteriales bacterium]
MKLKFYLRQLAKMAVQNLLLPVVYQFYRKQSVIPGRVIFADAHHEDLPFSMRRLYRSLIRTDLSVQMICSDYGKDGFRKNLKNMLRFMKHYARAEYVIVCDNFLPAASCRKRPETKVIQLWHACGALKKFGQDTTEDVPSIYKGNVFKNCDYVTVSSDWCIPYYASAMGLPAERIVPVGISRTDDYYDPAFVRAAKKKFEKNYPQAVNKKVLLWAPTFRGNAAMPTVCGEEAIDAMAEELGAEWFVIKSLHPHLLPKDAKKPEMTSEELLVVTDLLITDYSSILFDYLIYRRPLLLFAPDLREYEKKRGFYMDYRSLPGRIIKDGTQLAQAVRETEKHFDPAKAEETFLKYMGACDGHATERIRQMIGTR